MKLSEKHLKLKNDKNLILTSPKIENAQEIADYLNTIAGQTRFMSIDIDDAEATREGEEKWITEIAKDEKSLNVIAQVDGKIVGLGNVNPKRISRIRYRHACLIGISILKEYWGLGIASAIMSELIDFAKKTGFEQIELDVVSTNESAIHLYKKYGFVEVGHLIHAMKYTDGTYADFIKMQKFLI